MKKVILSLVVLPVMVWAHGSKVEATSEAVKETLALFEKSESEQTKSNFAGIKAWPSGAAITAKVYVNENNKEVTLSYSCVMEHSNGNDRVVCKKQ